MPEKRAVHKKNVKPRKQRRAVPDQAGPVPVLRLLLLLEDTAGLC